MNSKGKNKKKKKQRYAVYLYTDNEWVFVLFIFEMKTKYGSGPPWCGMAHTLLRSSVIGVKSEQRKFLNKGVAHCFFWKYSEGYREWSRI